MSSDVLVTVSDKKIGVSSNGTTIDYYNADIVTANDYYPGGMQMPGRKYQAGSGSYRFSINGQEKESDLNENITTAMFWEYDSRTGRRWNVDPITKEFESPYATFGGNPVLMVDPLGLDWYKDTKGKNKGDVVFMEGSGKHKGYQNITGTWTNRNSRGFSYLYGHGKEDVTQSGPNDLLSEVVVSSKGKKKDNSLMERMLQVSNVTKASMEEYNARPKPSYYDPNPLKTIFWDAGVGALNPVKDLDVYASASIKQKTQVGNVSGTLVWGGVQVGVTTTGNEGVYGNLITGDNSYFSYKYGNSEIRGLPFRGLGVTAPFFKQPTFGDYAPQLRVISDIAVYRGILIQSEIASGKNPSLGLRGKVESPKLLGWSAEVVVGARASLQAPPLYNAIMEAIRR